MRLAIVGDRRGTSIICYAYTPRWEHTVNPNRAPDDVYSAIASMLSAWMSGSP